MRKNRRHNDDAEFSILALDDDPIMTAALQAYFRSAGYRVEAENDPAQAIQRVREGSFDIMLLDFLMTPICGDQVVEQIRRFDRDIFIILLTGHKSMAPPIKTIRALDIQGYYEKSDRFDQLEMLVESCVKSIRQMRQIRQTYLEMAQAICLMVEAKSIYTRGHSDRVANYAQQLAAALGHDQAYCEQVRLAGLFHDLGKLGVPDGILSAERGLQDEEVAVIRDHPQRGYDILSVISMFREIAPIVLSHHERPDGHGYPRGLSGEEIPEMAQIISIADAFDAMTSPRSYRPELQLEQAIDQLRQGRGTQFNAQMADVFLTLIPGLSAGAPEGEPRTEERI